MAGRSVVFMETSHVLRPPVTSGQSVLDSLVSKCLLCAFVFSMIPVVSDSFDEDLPMLLYSAM
jgi:hypothetical protein